MLNKSCRDCIGIIAQYSDGKILCEGIGFNRCSYFCKDYSEREFYLDFTLD